ncbi:MAG: Gfo/Idh/MocA family protein [Bythopirellula sp.]
MSSTNEHSESDPANAIGRRSFLRQSATASAAITIPYYVPSSVLARPGAPGANDRVRVGIIGTGGRAGAIAKSCAGIGDLQIVSVCDCFAPRCCQFAKKVGEGQNWTVYEDFRKMIEMEDLDGVMVETTTHARAWIVIQAMQAGMDAYIEKPMSLTIAEGRYMVESARRHDQVTQVGTQQRSMPINNWASDLVKNGAIGKIKTVLAPNFVGPDVWKPLVAEAMPTGGSDNWWDVWTNQAELRPYHSRIHHDWSRWEDYDSGGLCYGVTGWGTHSYDQIQRALGTDETGPVEVLLEEPVRHEKCGKFENIIEDATHLEYLHRLAKPVEGPRANVRMKYADGVELRLHLDGDWGPGLGAIFVGEKGKIEINRNKISSNPKELVESQENPGPITKPETQYHIENWVECIKTRERCNADIEYGQRASTICYLVNIARNVGRVGEKLAWDPAAERFTNCDAANAMLSRPRRKGYELPELT